MKRKKRDKVYLLPGYDTKLDIIYPEFKSLMARRGWGMSRLAEETHVNKTTLRAVLTGFTRDDDGNLREYKPSDKTKLKLAINLGIPSEVLFRKAN